MSVEFDTPANRVIAQQQPKNQFRIDTSLPDIAFLRQLSIQGRMRYFQGFGNTSSEPITITPIDGETLFIAGGSWTGGSAVSELNIHVRNNGNLRERVFFPLGIQASGNFNFGVDSLVGNNIKQFTVIGSAVNTTHFNLWGWVENTSRIRDVTT